MNAGAGPCPLLCIVLQHLTDGPFRNVPCVGFRLRAPVNEFRQDVLAVRIVHRVAVDCQRACAGGYVELRNLIPVAIQTGNTGVVAHIQAGQPVRVATQRR